MKVKVVRCSKSYYWYYGHSGEIFEVGEDFFGNESYVVLFGSFKGEFLLKTDCEIVEEVVEGFDVGDVVQFKNELLSNHQEMIVVTKFLDSSNKTAVNLVYYSKTSGKYCKLDEIPVELLEKGEN